VPVVISYSGPPWRTGGDVENGELTDVPLLHAATRPATHSNAADATARGRDLNGPPGRGR
jgi:hypothetical protein